MSITDFYNWLYTFKKLVRTTAKGVPNISVSTRGIGLIDDVHMPTKKHSEVLTK